MNAKELRIGNWINVTFSSIVKQQVVDCMCDSVNTKCHESLPFDFIEPIPLTEEWLLKFGFEAKADSHNEYKKHFICDGDDDYELYVFPTFDLKDGYVCQLYNYYDYNGDKDDRERVCLPIPIKYVHSLQNLYFALTGEELTIKES